MKIPSPYFTVKIYIVSIKKKNKETTHLARGENFNYTENLILYDVITILLTIRSSTILSF